MEQNMLENSNGFTLFPILSLIIFFVFFTALIIWVFKMNKKILKEMAEIPFNNFSENIKDFTPGYPPGYPPGQSRKSGIKEEKEL